jgi:hypothetical protein
MASLAADDGATRSGNPAEFDEAARGCPGDDRSRVSLGRRPPARYSEECSIGGTARVRRIVC